LSSLRDYLFHEEPGITLYCGDAQDLLPKMEPPIQGVEFARVLISDPPYGVAFDGKATKHTTVKSGGYTTTDDPLIGPAVVRSVLPNVARAAVFPGTRNLHDYPKPADIGAVYCPSGAGIGRWGFTCFHPILFYGTRPSSQLHPTSIESFDTANIDGHPCPKPLRWMLWLVSRASLPLETVIDPFCGSGTTLEAAKTLNRRAIGIEIEPKYCEIAVKRLRQEVLPL